MNTDQLKADAVEKRDRFVDKYIIRDKCAHDPCASKNGVKTRAVMSVILPSIAVLLALGSLPVPDEVTVLVPLATVYLGVKTITPRINEKIERTECCHGGASA